MKISNVYHSSGPGMLSETLNAWVGSWTAHGQEEFEELPFATRYGALGDIVSLWQQRFYPYWYQDATYAVFDPADYPEAWMAHHWEGAWHRKDGETE